MNTDLQVHIKQMLGIFKNLVDGEKLIDEVGKINVKGDASIGMDIKAEELFVNYLKESNLPVSVFSEENGIIPIHNDPKYLVAFDPLDGSTNYKIGNSLLPYGCLIAFYNGMKPKLRDVVASGAIEITKNIAWVYDGVNTSTLSGDNIFINNKWLINKSTPVYLDLYYKDGYNLYASLPERVFVRNTGSTVGNLSYLLSNVSAALGGICMRPEEIGAVYSLIKGAGGKAVDHDGKDLGDKEFNSNSAYPILAGSKSVVEFCYKVLSDNK